MPGFAYIHLALILSMVPTLSFNTVKTSNFSEKETFMTDITYPETHERHFSLEHSYSNMHERKILLGNVLRIKEVPDSIPRQKILFQNISIHSKSSYDLFISKDDSNSSIDAFPQLEIEDPETMFKRGCRIVILEQHPKDGFVVDDETLNNSSGSIAVKCSDVNITLIAPFIPNNTVYLEIHNCSGGQWMTLNDDCLSHLEELKALNLSNCNFRVTSKFFKGLGSLTHLTCSRNRQLIALLPYVFNNTKLLEYVEFSAHIAMRPSTLFAALRKLTKLRSLRIDGSVQLKRIESKHLENLRNTNLEKLTMTSSQLHIVNAKAFEYLKKLKILDISFNPITESALEQVLKGIRNSPIQSLGLRRMNFLGSSIPTNALSHLFNSTTLYLLDLGLNTFITIEEGDIPYLPNLSHLFLDGCGINAITDYALLESVPNLTHLHLSGNWIHGIGFEILGLNKIKHLSISFMNLLDENQKQRRFNIVRNRPLENQTSLTILNLEGTAIRDVVSESMFRGMRMLSTLILAHCRITAIEDNAFYTLHSLKVLDLSGNSIRHIDSSTFFGLSKLTTLSLTNNVLTLKKDSKPFRYLVSLKHLIMQGNNITELSPRIFASLSELSLLVIGSNHIISWKERIFTNNKKLDKLRLDNNKITDITTAMMKDFENLKEINFAFNPLNCRSCEMVKFQKWIDRLNASNNTTFQLTFENEIPEAYVCKAPKEIENSNIFTIRLPDSYCFEGAMGVLQVVIILNAVAIALVIAIILALYFFRWRIRYLWFLVRTGMKRFREQTNENSYYYDAFVSYSLEDKDWVQNQLLPALENDQDDRLRLCIPERDFEPGRPIADNILESVGNSRKTILILSNEFITNEWCMFEMHMAEHKLFEERKESLILVCLIELDKMKLSRHLRYLIRSRTFIPWTTNSTGQKLFWERLKFSLKKTSTRYRLPHII